MVDIHIDRVARTFQLEENRYGKKKAVHDAERCDSDEDMTSVYDAQTLITGGDDDDIIQQFQTVNLMRSEEIVASIVAKSVHC